MEFGRQKMSGAGNIGRLQKAHSVAWTDECWNGRPNSRPMCRIWTLCQVPGVQSVLNVLPHLDVLKHDSARL